MTQYCTANSGTTFKYYNWIKTIWNTFVVVLADFSEFLSYFGTYVGVALPSGAILPLYDKDNPLPLLPDKKFWAVKIGLRNSALPDITVPLPQKEILDLWKDLISPIDYMIPGSEAWFYNVNGVVAIGSSFEPMRQYGVLSDGVETAIDLTVLYYGLKVLKALGLSAAVTKIITTLFCYIKNKSFISKLEGMSEDLEHIQPIDLTNIESGIKELNSKIGVRLLLR